MEPTILPGRAANQKEQRTYVARLLAALALILFVSYSGSFGRAFLLEDGNPWWLHLAVVMVPWLLVALYLFVYRRLWPADELEDLINHRAIVSAFYGMFAVIALTGQLQLARLIPEFAWTTTRLIMMMAGLMLAGVAWNKVRYL